MDRRFVENARQTLTRHSVLKGLIPERWIEQQASRPYLEDSHKLFRWLAEPDRWPPGEDPLPNWNQLLHELAGNPKYPFQQKWAELLAASDGHFESLYSEFLFFRYLSRDPAVCNITCQPQTKAGLGEFAANVNDVPHFFELKTITRVLSPGEKLRGKIVAELSRIPTSIYIRFKCSTGALKAGHVFRILRDFKSLTANRSSLTPRQRLCLPLVDPVVQITILSVLPPLPACGNTISVDFGGFHGSLENDLAAIRQTVSKRMKKSTHQRSPRARNVLAVDVSYSDVFQLNQMLFPTVLEAEIRPLLAKSSSLHEVLFFTRRWHLPDLLLPWSVSKPS